MYNAMPDKRTYKDRNKNNYMVIAVTERRKKLKLMAIDYKGGKCCVCGYNKCVRALAFHHLDPKIKSFSLGINGLTRSWERIKRELDKCVLVCHNCHCEIESGITFLEK
jgi:CO dehydrogenase nickel-insertion accessory protein CooC1